MNPSSSLLNFSKVLPLSLVISFPFNNIFPVVTVSIVEIQFRSVVLPLPDAPIIPTKSPFSTLKLIPSIAFVTLSLLP